MCLNVSVPDIYLFTCAFIATQFPISNLLDIRQDETYVKQKQSHEFIPVGIIMICRSNIEVYKTCS